MRNPLRMSRVSSTELDAKAFTARLARLVKTLPDPAEHAITRRVSDRKVLDSRCSTCPAGPCDPALRYQDLVAHFDLVSDAWRHLRAFDAAAAYLGWPPELRQTALDLADAADDFGVGFAQLEQATARLARLRDGFRTLGSQAAVEISAAQEVVRKAVRSLRAAESDMAAVAGIVTAAAASARKALEDAEGVAEALAQRAELIAGGDTTACGTAALRARLARTQSQTVVQFTCELNPDPEVPDGHLVAALAGVGV